MKGYEAGGSAFVGCIIMGFGLGLLFGQVLAGSVIGLGAGFLAMALFRARF
ncbi:MAG: hypothetical protein K6T83_21345 [Alicyclobacillus sp.]|nr:hypothetical protein [Alicyclobacillus sp.]